MADNLLDKASILLTPTAHDNGKMLSIKPTNGDGDFTFSRNSAATRVNAQGLVENVQILSGDLVQNGSFSEIGAEEVTNGSFTNGSTDWTFVGGAELTEQGARIYSSSGGQSYINQDALTNTKSYKISYDIVDSTQGALKLINVNGVSDYPIPSTVGSHIVYFTANNNTLFIYRNSGATDVTITNISVKEVGQNWTFGDGFTPDQANSKATCDGTQSAATNLTQTISTNIQNKLVRVSFTLDYTAGVLLGSLSGTGAVDFNNITSSGTYTAEMTSNEVNPPLILQGDTNFIGSITNIVLLEVTNDTNLPRINYENGCGSWLLEPQSTNIYLNSETLSTQDNTTLASTYTVSFYGTGTITFSGTHTGSLVGTSLTDRVSATFTATAGTLTSTVTGTVTKGQLEQQSYATSYIPTSGATSTRLRDLATDSGNSTLINSTEGVLYFEAKTDELNVGSISINDGTASNRITARFRSDISKIQLSIIGSTDDFNLNSDAITLLDYNKIAIIYDNGDYYFFINGVKSSVQSRGTFSANTFTQLDFNRGGGGEVFYGKVKALAVYKEALTDAELTALTTI